MLAKNRARFSAYAFCKKGEHNSVAKQPCDKENGVDLQEKSSLLPNSLWKTNRLVDLKCSEQPASL